MNSPINHHQALIYTMVIISAADSQMTDEELFAIGEIVRMLPVFEGFDPERLVAVAQQCAEILGAESGLETVLALIRQALPERLHETAYVLACDIAASDGHLGPEELRLLELVRHCLDIDRLQAAAIERGAAARYARF